MFTDQRWVDFVPSFFDHSHPQGSRLQRGLLEPARAANVTRDGDRYLVDGVPLRFFHFSGFDVQQAVAPEPASGRAAARAAQRAAGAGGASARSMRHASSRRACAGRRDDAAVRLATAARTASR